MSFSVLSPDLFDAVRILNLAPSEAGTLSSDFFLARPTEKSNQIKLSVAGSIMAEVCLTGSGQWPSKKPFWIPRQLFSDWVNEAKKTNTQSVFDFTLKEKLVITNGKRKTGYDSYEGVTGYIDLPTVTGAKLDLDPELIKYLECASTCAITDEKKNPILSCVFASSYKDTVELLATNEPAVLRIKLKAALKNKIVFPVNMLDVLKSDGLKSLHWTDRSIVAKFPTGAVWHPLLAEAEEGFPADAMRTVMDDMGKEPLVFKIELSALSQVLSTLSSYLASVRKDDWKVIIVGKKGERRLQLLVKLSYCTFREEVDCQTLKSDFKFLWPVNLISPVMFFLDNNTEEKLAEVRLAKSGNATFVSCGPVELVLSTEEV